MDLPRVRDLASRGPRVQDGPQDGRPVVRGLQAPAGELDDRWGAASRGDAPVSSREPVVEVVTPVPGGFSTRQVPVRCVVDVSSGGGWREWTGHGVHEWTPMLTLDDIPESEDQPDDLDLPFELQEQGRPW